MKINKYHGNYNISKRTMPIKYIVVHYTGDGTSKAGSAKNNCIFFSGGDRDASAHYFIDDGGVWEYANPKEYYTWHCGDGHGRYGISNANSIGIEVCQNYDQPFTETEIRYLTELVLLLMNRFGVYAEHVVRHYDASRKLCPLYYAKRQSEWDKLRNRITGHKTTKRASETKPASTTAISTKDLVKKGQKGLNKILGAELVIDGSRGAKTKKCEVMAVQAGLNKDYKCQLAVDGSYGYKTKACMSHRAVQYGDTGALVKAVQCILYTHGYNPKGIDGHCGNGMVAAIKAFQKKSGLTVDGSCGAKTMLRLLS